MEGKLTILALTHFGPDDATRALSPIGFNANGFWRFYNDVLMTWKATETWTFVTEANWARDGFGNAANPGKPVNGFGVAQYVSYALTETIALNARAEVWRDDNNFFVASFPATIRLRQVPAGLLDAECPLRARHQHDLWRLHPGRDLEAGDARADHRAAGPAGDPLGSRVHRQQAIQQQPPFNTKGTNNSFTFGADVVLTF